MNNHTNKLDNLEDMDEILETWNIPREDHGNRKYTQTNNE